ncbi:hypothetical protein LX32DRAFT_342612 [Colletotrichum zoysiae]|uniref:Uncharacterized protein n=1 Tax=Colletotrichum zoysiae TaxID=1216348 RepID=A0AAD9M5R1_9PEZI|nr:hypothetical protein LX32DRAFT_342612 [Colletotrichum zoysiae]
MKRATRARSTRIPQQGGAEVQPSCKKEIPPCGRPFPIPHPLRLFPGIVQGVAPSGRISQARFPTWMSCAGSCFCVPPRYCFFIYFYFLVLSFFVPRRPT